MRRYSVLLATLLLACLPPDPESRAHRATEDAVHVALLESCCVVRVPGRPAPMIMLRERLAPDAIEAWHRQWLSDSVAGLPYEVVEEFERLAGDTSLAAPLQVHGAPLHMLPDSVFYRYFNAPMGRDAWPAFRVAFPEAGGVVRLARVGLSRDGMWALTYVESRAGALSGAGFLYVLRKERGTWRVVRRLNQWMS
jgi:hypothetical protein